MNATTTVPLPAIENLQMGEQFISALPLADPKRAHDELNQFLDCLAEKPPATGIYIQLLEQLRIPLCFVAEELAHSFSNKALPLGNHEAIDFKRVTDALRKVARAYHQCALLAVNTPAPDTPRAELTLCLQRSIYYSGQLIVEHYRARQALPPGLWLEMHACFAMSEARGMDTDPVADALDSRERSTHCASTLIGVLLAELTGPYGLSIRDQGVLRRWADSWAPLASLRPVMPDEPLPPIVIDLKQDAATCARNDESPRASLRCLDLSRLTLQLRELHHQLRHKASPSDLGLGEDCTAGQCRRLLEHLATAWSQLAHAPRKYRRRAATGNASVCSGFEAMHYFISGEEFSPPTKRAAQTRIEYESLFAFPQMVESEHTLQISRARLGLTCEAWQIINQSANGFRMRRAGPGKTVAHGQLLAVRPQEGAPFLLTRVNWLMQESRGDLIAGVEALPGIPLAIAARPLTQTEAHSEPYMRAFLLPAIPAMETEASLLLPSGWYRPSRTIEIVASASRRVELLRVLNDGADFEHVSFAAAK